MTARAWYAAILSDGPLPLRLGTITDDGTTVVYEYEVEQWGSTRIPPQAGAAAYERGASGVWSRRESMTTSTPRRARRGSGSRSNPENPVRSRPCGQSAKARGGGELVPRVLIAQPADWHSTARLPAMFARAGITCDLIDPGNTSAAASSRLRKRITCSDGVDALAEEVLRRAGDYRRVVICNEQLIRAVMRIGGKDAGRALAGSRAGLRAACNKTLFSPVARAGGLRVPDFEIAESPQEAAQAAARLGGRVVVEGALGGGGVLSQGRRLPRRRRDRS